MTSGQWPPKFTIDTERVLRLFTGDRFYSSADAALREAILNAIDACGRRTVDEAGLVPKIDVLFDADARTVAIVDNGDGMGAKELQELFARVGASAAQLADRTATGQYRAVGEFGIGVVSYFLISERYQVHTKKAGQEALGLEFGVAMLDGATPATPISPQREDVGTTLILFVKDERLFTLLVERFPFWARDVTGLTAMKQPGDVLLHQGGLRTAIRPVALPTPSWIEAASLGPPLVFGVWNALDGRAHVDVLYRGVFVDRLEVDRLWGIDGVIHVDPKYFKPKLNREGFVGSELREEVTRFLQEAHPTVLAAAVDCLREVLSDENTKDWTVLRWVTLWLAVPRTGAYGVAAKLWDEEFRKRKAFRLLLSDGSSTRDVSIADLQGLKVDQLFLAPTALDSTTDVVKQAVRVLRARGAAVVQGIPRDGGYLGYASLTAQSTGELLVQHFRQLLPQLVQIEHLAEKLVQEEAVAEIFQGPPRVRVVRLGSGGAPLVGVGSEVWINVENAAGRKVIHELCDRNEGLPGLWLATLRHAPGHVGSIAAQLQRLDATPTRLGPVTRQYLRSLAS